MYATGIPVVKEKGKMGYVHQWADTMFKACVKKKKKA